MMQDRNERKYRFICGIGGVIGLYLMYSSDGYLSSGEDISIFQFKPSSIGAVVIILVTYIASKTPNDILQELIGISTDTPVRLGYFTAGCWFVAGIIVSLTPEFSEFISNTFPPLGALLALIVVPIGAIIYFPILFGFPALLGAWVVGITPLFLMGIKALTATTETLEVAKQHTKSTLPAAEIERRLADAIGKDMAFDDGIIIAIHNLPFFSRLKHTYMYKVKRKKYERMWQLIKAQEEMLREQTETAKAAHQYERTKRTSRNNPR